jgi:predicted nicotinamide N-methyase
MDGHRLDTPYWAYHWGGGLALARYVLDHAGLVAGRRVLDLGAGSGIVGIAAAKTGASEVIAVDTDPHAMAAAHLNATANGVDLSTLVRDILDDPPPAVDIVLAADLFYEQRLAQRVTDFLRRCLAARIDVLVGDPYRPFLPRSELRMLKEYSVPDFGLGNAPTASAVFCSKGSKAIWEWKNCIRKRKVFP